jgi:hypothetical protein
MYLLGVSGSTAVYLQKIALSELDAFLVSIEFETTACASGLEGGGSRAMG